MRRFVRAYVERRHGSGTEAAAALMLDLVTGADMSSGSRPCSRLVFRQVNSSSIILKGGQDGQ